ncbi:MAG TPA: quinone oxidoreductase [Planctomycetota bacterium]|jgi:NADPH2:quinone reductase|nr:quinone oxidoreductase [Planctomycetota bacterium]OQC20280.1 MAG: Quinone oxidoreductase 1 [Planctomycetes bacterium ADurb.Bin069]HNR99942.1 quinone oxidoreductase [Planctomycetota bacterium]HNU24828.1 quinone oxidoreductase [Planctomycetota bacterium]HOE29430.1 quinone oxidoreductase [Planctomycetota bacterium]
MKAIRVHAPGGPEKLLYEDAPVPAPAPGQARVRVHAAGLNFIDIYHRTGLYKLPLPFTPGVEAAGVVDAVGAGVAGLSPGDRVAYAMNVGAYAEYALADARQLVPLPAEIDFPLAAAVMLQGMTAHYLAFSTFALKPGQTALVHAAAGGVGLLLIQIVKRIGAKVIGTTGNAAKAALAREAGADHVILYSEQDFEAEVKRITGGAGVDVVYDSVGRTTFEKGLNCLKPRGTMVLYGQSSGVVPPFDLNLLNTKGSLYVTRPALGHYLAAEGELRRRAGDILKWVAARELRIRIDRRFPLQEAAEAHRLLESRQTAGKVLLIP